MENLKNNYQEDIIRELAAERAAREYCEEQYIEYCAIEQADEYTMQNKQIECSCSKCARVKEELRNAILKINRMNDEEYSEYINKKIERSVFDDIRTI